MVRRTRVANVDRATWKAMGMHLCLLAKQLRKPRKEDSVAVNIRTFWRCDEREVEVVRILTDERFMVKGQRS